MIGLVLQGGGAKGAYQSGALLALFEDDYNFSGVCGTSIGAINAAFVCQGDIKLLYKLWEEMDMNTIYDLSSNDFTEFITNPETSTIKKIYYSAKAMFLNKGLDMNKAVEFITKYLNEEKMRKSDIEFGLTTVSIKEGKMEPIQLFKEDIKEGKLIDYIIASANYPLFKRWYIDDVPFIDGGLYDNLPINMLANKEYRKIIAITLGNTIAPIKKSIIKNAEIIYLTPSEKLTNALNFENSTIKHMQFLGYYDTKRYLKKIYGKNYYINIFEEKYALNLFMNLSEESLKNITETLNINQSEDKLSTIFKIMSQLINLFDLVYNYTATDVLIELTESLAVVCEIEKYKVFELKNLMELAYFRYNNPSVFTIKKPRNYELQKRLDISNLIIKSILECN